MILNWFSPVWGHNNGYGNAAEQMIRALEKRGHTVGITLQESITFSGPCDRSWIQAHRPTKAKTGVYFTLPTTWMGAYRRNIGFSMYESSAIPTEWVPWLDKVHEIWVPSSYCKNVFAAYTKRPISVIPLGVNPDLFPVRLRPHRRRIRFLHMWSAHNLRRKGADLAIEAFEKAFPDGGAQLVVQAALGEPPDSLNPNVVYTRSTIPQNAIADYLASFDALLYTSRGEGFGLLALEAAATAMPVFHSGQTGMSDYRNIGVVVPANEVHAGDQEGTWFEVDTDRLATEIRAFAQAPDAYLTKALADAQFVRRHFSWDSTAEHIERRLAAL